MPRFTYETIQSLVLYSNTHGLVYNKYKINQNVLQL